jgi:hypothetical protein
MKTVDELPMIDREARKNPAEIVRRFISGQITNFKFEARMPVTKDLAVRAIENSLWCFYDDFKEHSLSGEWKLPDETKSIMARWIMFLHTDEEYRWPNMAWPGVRPLQHGFFSRLFKGPQREQKFMSAGCYAVWPFINKESFGKARQNPVLFAGNQ